MSKPFGIIYKATNLVNGKCYIGQTTNLAKRKLRHKSNILDDKNSAYFYNAVRKYGWCNFTWEVLCECDTKELLNIRETMKIIVNHSHWTECGYNMTWGGEGSMGYKASEKTKKKLSDLSKGKNNPMYGKHHTDMAKRIISLKNVGRIKSDDVKDYIAIQTKKKYNYIFISPNGDKYSPLNIKRFCRENNLKYNCIKHLCAGRNKTHRGWRVERFTELKGKK